MTDLDKDSDGGESPFQRLAEHAEEQGDEEWAKINRRLHKILHDNG